MLGQDLLNHYTELRLRQSYALYKANVAPEGLKATCNHLGRLLGRKFGPDFYENLRFVYENSTSFYKIFYDPCFRKT
jgi:hypothetical protein